MSAISPPSPCAFSDQNPHRLTFGAARFPFHLSRIPGAALCRCLGHSDSLSPSSSSGGDSSGRGWDSALREAFKNAVNRLDLYVNSHRNPVKDARRDLLGRQREVVEDEDWDWDQWKKHFEEVEAQERIVSILKSQLGYAVLREDYEDAARLKVAIAAAATNDIVGRVMFNLNSAIEEERYKDAILIRDCAGAGLVGWWAGISHDASDPYGRIIRISAEHGRYVARSYSPRQLATATAGVPLFEIFLRVNRKGEYKQQAVYLKRQVVSQDSTTISSMSKGVSSSVNQLDSSDPDKNEALPTTLEDVEDGVDINDDSDVVSGLSGFQNIMQDIIPGVKVKVVKVTVPGKVDRDLISKVIEQIIEEEDDVKDTEQENIGTDDDTSSGNDEEQNEIETEASAGVANNEERSELPVKVIVGGLIHKFSRSASKDLQRVPAELVKKGRLSFSFSIEKDDNKWNSHGKGQSSSSRKAKLPGQRSIMFDLSKFIGRKKIPLQVLKDVGELINLTLSQAQNHQPLSALTTFSRIEIPESSDPLNGLYIGGHGLYTSEVIHLKRKYGQWQEDGQNKEHSDIEFYEYVEALKITGDPYVPAGQVAFRAKVGKRNQLPHRGIIPEEFGVIARYRGQGRLAEPGFQNPRWVDGELVILDGKYIKGGPVVGFVYWSPEYHFLVFFNRLRLQE